MSLVVERKKEVLREEGVAKVGTQINLEGECCALHSAQTQQNKYRRAERKAKMEGWQVISSIAMNLTMSCTDIK